MAAGTKAIKVRDPIMTATVAIKDVGSGKIVPPSSSSRKGAGLLAVRKNLTAVITNLPAGVTPTYQWQIVSGNVIRKYVHDLDNAGKHVVTPFITNDPELKKIDLSFFPTTPSTDITVKITVSWGTAPNIKSIESTGKIAIALPTRLQKTHTGALTTVKETDLSFQVYCVDDGAETTDKFTPGYSILPSHTAWHDGTQMTDGPTGTPVAPEHSGSAWGDANFGTSAYNGSAFLDWHHHFLAAHMKWRQTFNVSGLYGTPLASLPAPAFPEPSPPAGATAEFNGTWPLPNWKGDSAAPTAADNFVTPPFPVYFESNPTATSSYWGTIASPVYGYVRFGEFQDIDELGDDVVDPYHNTGHGSIVRALIHRYKDTDYLRMGGYDSPGTPNDFFWKWHGKIDELWVKFVSSGTAKDKAIVTDMSPKAPAVPPAGNPPAPEVTGAFTEVTVTFNKRVSFGAPVANTIQLKANHLKVVSSGDPTVTLEPTSEPDDQFPASNPYKIFKFTIPQPADGTVTITLDGEVGGKSSYTKKVWSFTYKLNP